jgi:hypothetical protein
MYWSLQLRISHVFCSFCDRSNSEGTLQFHVFLTSTLPPYSSTCFSHPLCRPLFIFRPSVSTNVSTKLSFSNSNAYSLILFLEIFKGVVSVPIIHCLSLSTICLVSQLQLFQILHCTFLFCITSCPHSAVPLDVSFPSVHPGSCWRENLLYFLMIGWPYSIAV